MAAWMDSGSVRIGGDGGCEWVGTFVVVWDGHGWIWVWWDLEMMTGSREDKVMVVEVVRSRVV